MTLRWRWVFKLPDFNMAYYLWTWVVPKSYRRKALHLCRLVAPQTRLYSTRKQEHFKQNTERCLVAQKHFVRAFFRVALYFLHVHALQYFPLLLNLCYFKETSRLMCNKQLTTKKMLLAESRLHSLLVCVKSPHLLIRILDTNKEFKIYDATATTMSQFLHFSWLKTKALHALPVLCLFLYISFPFSGNLQLEMPISQVLQRTWTHRREFEFSFLALTPHLEIQFLSSPASSKKLHKLTQWQKSLTSLNLQFWAALDLKLPNKYILLTKREVKMAGYWPSSLFGILWTEKKLRSIKTQTENEAIIQLSWLK